MVCILNCVVCGGAGVTYRGPQDIGCKCCGGTGLEECDLDANRDEVLAVPELYLERACADDVLPEWLAAQGWTFWDLHPSDRGADRFPDFELPEGPSRDVEWAALSASVEFIWAKKAAA